MDLLVFYLKSIFQFLSFPGSEEVCSNAGGIKDFCTPVVDTAFYFPVILVFITLVSGFRPKLFFKILFISVISTISCFYFADRILQKLSTPESYSFEAYIILFNLWCFINFNLLLVSLIFENRKFLFFISGTAISIVFVALFAEFGRGSFEHATSLIGGLFITPSVKLFFKGYLPQLIFSGLILSIILGLVFLALEWLKSGNIIPKLFFSRLTVFALFLLVSAIGLLSLPFGILKNNDDVAEAENFINELKSKIDKYYYENGEYPKIIDEFIDKKQSPRLLERHEFFSFGIRGTYYFSRSDKYCFIFQNPAMKFGYYAMTSTQGWHFTNSFDSFDNVYINACGETNEASDQLISNHLGMENPDDFINSKAIEYNSPNIKPETKKASEELNERILEYGKENPEIFQYYGNRPENYKELIKEKYGE